MEYRILGPLEASIGGRRLDLGGPKPRALLAILLVRAGEVVADDVLIEELWGAAAPKSARHLVQVYVSNLRRALEPSQVLVTRAPGYLLELSGGGELDARRFERLLAEGRRLLARGDPAGAAEVLSEATALWRGPALADFTYEPFAQAEIARLEELRVVALEERIEADLALGRHVDLVGELGALVAEQPLRERPRGQLMLALYRSGRQADALDRYRDGRELLVEELGIEPGPALQRLQQAILRQDSELELAPREPAPVSVARKLVTVVVARAADAAQLDPEVRRGAVAHALDAAGAVLARHGATVRRSLDDSVLAVFGVPDAHEDDALRAARAATEAAGPAIGIEAGEVLVEGEAIEGEAVSRAVRLSQDAQPGEAVLGETAYRLVGHAVMTEPGRGAERRLIAVLADAPALPRRLDAPLVGRADELGRLAAEFAAAVRSNGPRLVTVIGDPGVGKSKLAEELVGALGDEATALVGRCISYGEGMAFWPLREMLRQAGAALDTEGSRRPEEAFRAFRAFFEERARERPLLLVVDDIHWAQPTFLDFLEYLAGSSRAPMLLLCLTRPDLLEERPSWPGGLTLMLEPLSATESEALVERLGGRLPREAVARVVAAAEGNPLFLEQLLAMVMSGPRSRDELALPPTVRALLTARLDRLGPAERALIERAAIVGVSFGQDAVVALLPEPARASVPRHLEALACKAYVRPEGGERFRFQHALIQEAAYRTIPKALRAELHEQLGEWLDPAVADDELVGYHLERAWLYRRELGEPAPELAGRAGARLWAAARRATARADLAASVSLFERAAALLSDEPTGALLEELGASLSRALQHDRARPLLAEAIERAAAAGDLRTELRARLDRWWATPIGRDELMHPEVEQLIPRLEELGDDLGLTKAWQLLAYGLWQSGAVGAQQEPLERALVHARRAGDPLEESEIVMNLLHSFYRGPMPAAEGVRRCDEALAEGLGGRLGEAAAQVAGGALRSMLGAVDEGRALMLAGKAIYEDFGFWGYVPWQELFQLEMLAGDPVAAERWLRDGRERTPESLSLRSLHTAGLTHALCAQGRYDEAGELVAGRERSPWDMIRTQVLWSTAEAKVLAARGELARAEEVARAAVALAEGTDDLNGRADALVVEAEILLRAGRDAEAPRRTASGLYERKGNLVMARRLGSG